jgi:hypothetical protein
MNKTRCYTYATSLATLVVLGLVFYQYPNTQLVYAHTFSGNESSAFIATIGVLRTEIRLINSTVSTNASQANEHAKIAVEHLTANDTSELAERNKRIGTDLPKDLSDLQNMTANLSPTNMTTGITAIKQKVSDTDALLSEALQVRIEPDQIRNATVYGTAVADLLNETLERYGEALGIGENASSATTSSTATTGGNSSISNATTSANTTASMSNNTSSTIANYADYQSTIGLVNITKEMLNQTKSLMNTTTSSSAIAKVDNDLNELKSLIDNKSSYTQVATFVYDTIYPDLNSAFGLGLQKVDAAKAIEEAKSAKEEGG